jgi:hypothetical protein
VENTGELSKDDRLFVDILRRLGADDRDRVLAYMQALVDRQEKG